MKLNDNELMVLVARLAYRAAIDEMAAIQRRVAARTEIHQRFGKHAVAQNRGLRAIYGERVLSDNPEIIENEHNNDMARHARLVAVVEALEAAFAAHRANHDQAFAEAMAAHLRRARGKD